MWVKAPMEEKDRPGIFYQGAGKQKEYPYKLTYQHGVFNEGEEQSMNMQYSKRLAKKEYNHL